MKNFWAQFPEYFIRGVVALFVMAIIWAMLNMIYMNPAFFGLMAGIIGAVIVVVTFLGWFIRDVMKL